MENTSNYSRNRIVSKKKTDEYLRQTNNSTARQVNFEFTIKPDIRRLNYRAETFAFNFKSHGDLNLSKILRIPEWQLNSKLKELYIYSYIKCLHNSLFFHKLDSTSSWGFCFHGHSEMFYLLQQASFSYLHENIFVYMTINIGNDDKRRIMITKLITQFKFLAPYRGYLNLMGLQSFMIPEYENYFAYLEEDYYSKRAQGEPEKIDKNVKEDGHSTSRVISGEFNSKGRIKVVKVRNNETQTILNEENLPLTNAFASEGNKVLHYIEVGNGHEVAFNRSFFFCLSNDIQIVKNKDLANLSKNYFKTMIMSKDTDFLVASEVYTNTGIRCNTANILKSPSLMKEPLTIGKLDFETVFKLVEEKLSELTSVESILDFIQKLIDAEEDVEVDDEGGK